MRFAQNTSGRVLWSVMSGRLREEGPESFSFTMTATDTYVLLGLLLDSKDEIEVRTSGSKSISNLHRLTEHIRLYGCKCRMIG